MKISLKELRETRIWLLMIGKANLLPKPEVMESLIDETDQLISIFASSIKTAQKNKIKENNEP